jgi:hypothetical protein
LGSFSTYAWNWTEPVPWHSPTTPPIEGADPPNADEEPNPVDVPPNGEEVVVPVPNAGLFAWPKSPLVVFVAPNGEEVLLVFEEPNPPNPPVFVVEVPPKSPVPVVAAPKPEAGFAPNPLVCPVDPNPEFETLATCILLGFALHYLEASFSASFLALEKAGSVDMRMRMIVTTCSLWQADSFDSNPHSPGASRVLGQI